MTFAAAPGEVVLSVRGLSKIYGRRVSGVVVGDISPSPKADVG